VQWLLKPREYSQVGLYWTGNKITLSFSHSFLEVVLLFKASVNDTNDHFTTASEDLYFVLYMQYNVIGCFCYIIFQIIYELENNHSFVHNCRKLKGEKKYCMDELHCNIVIMKHSHPKILRLNLNSSPKKEGRDCALLLEPNAYTSNLKDNFEHSDIVRGPAVTPASSPEQGSPPLTVTDIGTASMSSSDPGTSPFFHSDNYDRRRRCFPFVVHEGLLNLEDIESDSESEKLSSSSKSSSFQPWISNVICVDGEFSKHEDNMQRSSDKSLVYEALLQKLTFLDQDPIFGVSTGKIDVNLSKSVREAISLARNAPHGPPPLCSICQHKGPAFGNPPRWFTFAELQLATGGFSQANFLAEGGFGSVHRGVLQDGQVVAVKQYKLASTQGDKEFCSEVEVLSCAQHRNVVMLIGFCVEDGRRLLVYEYICNGSLDSHLYGKSP